jgi:hypothetical protein
MATQGNIMIAALPFGCGLKTPLCDSGFFLAVRLPRFVMRQDVFLRLAVHNVDVVIGEIKWPNPVTGIVDEYSWALRTTNTASSQC